MNPNIEFLEQLESIIRQRIDSGDARSYTAKLVASGQTRVAQKVGEEALEFALAATSGSSDEQLDEAADLMFHYLVLLNRVGLSLEDVCAKLQQRHLAATRS